MSPSSFVSQSDWLVVPGCLSSLVSLHFPSSFVSQSYWLVVPGCLSSLVFLHLFPNLAHGVRLFGCLPVHLSPSLTGWWCPAVCLHLAPYICFPIWLMVSGSSDVSQYMCLPVWLAGDARQFVFTCLLTFVSQSGSWCPALRMSPSSFVSQSDWLVVPGCLSSLVSLHLFPSLVDVSLHLCPFICLPLCLVASGSSDVFSLLSLVSHQVSLSMCLPSCWSPN